MTIQVGSAAAHQGRIVTGWLPGIQLPTGSSDDFPVVVAQGREAGPTLWLTTGIHGDEQIGILILHRLINTTLLEHLRGTIIAVTSLNPAGLRTRQRQPYYLDGDPNRFFPDPSGERDEPTTGHLEIEIAYRSVIDSISLTNTACLVDLHNAFVGSIPFVLRDPVFYHRKHGGMHEARARSQASRLNNQLTQVLHAFGFTVVNDFAHTAYLTKNLHRSLSGAVLNRLGIPAFTVELGGGLYPEPGIAEAACIAVRNLMRRLGMLTGEPERITTVPVIDSGYSVRRYAGPHVQAAGIVDISARPGESVEKGQEIAQLRDVFGRPIGPSGGRIFSDHAGFILGWRQGVIRYKGEAVLSMAIRDTGSMLAPYPET